LGAVALGARVIEKHFTDDCSREGPDHPFSMDPPSWKNMVLRTRELEYALGSGDKRVEDNEKETVVVQRRSIRTTQDLKAGTVLTAESLEVLRPAPPDAIFPYEMDKVLGRTLRNDLRRGEHLRWNVID
jgi:sialic acid synthase SpsE